MALILHIDTAVSYPSICLAEDEQIIGYAAETTANSASAWLHPAIETLMQESNFSLQQLDAVSVTIGPGSYTGLRIGLAAAKGFCYALNKPLIGVGTLQMMTTAAAQQLTHAPANALLCPMIDARRHEVFTALYRPDLAEEMSPLAMVLDEKSFAEVLTRRPVLFFGNGSAKFAPMVHTKNALFVQVTSDARYLVALGAAQYKNGDFLSLAYSEPFYGKEFYTPPPRQKPI